MSPIQLHTTNSLCGCCAQDTINYIVPFLTFLTVLPLASVSSRSFDLNESSRRRPILTFFSFLVFGAVSTTILGGIWENSGFVLIIPTAFCFVIALNQQFLDGFWNRFFGSWSKRFSPDARPGPNDVSLALAGWIFLMALSAAVIYASRYLVGQATSCDFLISTVSTQIRILAGISQRCPWLWAPPKCAGLGDYPGCGGHHVVPNYRL